MLAYIKGIVTYKNGEKAIVESSGIGYELYMSAQSLAALPQAGNPTQVWTYLQAKEDGISLFGFADPAEKEIFMSLIAISGIGARIALSALSTFKPAELAACIAASDITAIATIPGIGKKTAQRMVLELQGVLSTDATIGPDNDERSSQLRDATSALESMGFSSDEVAAALKGCSETTTGDIIRYALRQVGGRA